MEEKRKTKRRFLGVMKEDLQSIKVTEEDAEDRLRWKWVICCGNP